jgi:hypothetical protein
MRILRLADLNIDPNTTYFKSNDTFFEFAITCHSEINHIVLKRNATQKFVFDLQLAFEIHSGLPESE